MEATVFKLTLAKFEHSQTHRDPVLERHIKAVTAVPDVRVFGTKSCLNDERVQLIGLISLCGALSVTQAWRFERLSFDPFDCEAGLREV